ncbi:hypothetical protein C943_02937 [Mariniradius saccharolyticus AK6]|uniref:Uncharacterized protein n=1 Tax=Mariniradius saccharolyticus AK6 TaxID=1239962 RepID=M7XC88_9BACT|nr:hypothetical protein C943_02937 [Mariniradius saccharolyticus AK6]
MIDFQWIKIRKHQKKHPKFLLLKMSENANRGNKIIEN